MCLPSVSPPTLARHAWPWSHGSPVPSRVLPSRAASGRSSRSSRPAFHTSHVTYRRPQAPQPHTDTHHHSHSYSTAHHMVAEVCRPHLSSHSQMMLRVSKGPCTLAFSHTPRLDSPARLPPRPPRPDSLPLAPSQKAPDLSQPRENPNLHALRDHGEHRRRYIAKKARTRAEIFMAKGLAIQQTQYRAQSALRSHL